MRQIRVEVKEMAQAASYYFVKSELEFSVLTEQVNPFLKLIDNFRKISQGHFATVKTCPHANDNFRSNVVRCDQHGEFWIALEGLKN